MLWVGYKLHCWFQFLYTGCQCAPHDTNTQKFAERMSVEYKSPLHQTCHFAYANVLRRTRNDAHLRIIVIIAPQLTHV